MVRQAAGFVDRIVLETNPAVQACRRWASSRLFVFQRIARKKRSINEGGSGSPNVSHLDGSLEVNVRNEGREKAKDVVNQPLDDIMKPSPATERVQRP